MKKNVVLDKKMMAAIRKAIKVMGSTAQVSDMLAKARFYYGSMDKIGKTGTMVVALSPDRTVNVTSLNLETLKAEELEPIIENMKTSSVGMLLARVQMNKVKKPAVRKPRPKKIPA